MVTPSPGYGPGVQSPLPVAPAPDAAYGLEYATQVLEADGLPDMLSPTEAPRLAQAAGAQFMSHAVLRAQIDDAARVVATDPASTRLVDRLRQTSNTLLEPAKDPIPPAVLNGALTLGGVVGTLVSMLPFLGFAVSPWLIIGVIVFCAGAYLLQMYNQSAATRSRERAKSEHEDAILALLRRADEIRAVLASQARQAAHVSLEPPAT